MRVSEVDEGRLGGETDGENFGDRLEVVLKLHPVVVSHRFLVEFLQEICQSDAAGARETFFQLF